MAYAVQRVIVNTKINDEDILIPKFDEVIEFANKIGAAFQIGRTANNEVVYEAQIKGVTSAYCKGVIAEIKQLVKDALHCKLEVVFYAY